MRRSFLVALIVSAVVIACGGSTSESDDAGSESTVVSVSPTDTAEAAPSSTRVPTPTFAPTLTPTANATTEPTPTREPTPIPIAHQGTGDARVETSLVTGLNVITMRHFGRDQFEVRLLTDDGEGRGQLAADRGSFQGSRAIAVRESGQYIVEIAADGDWEFEITHPIPETSIVRDLPLELAGTGVQAIYFVKATPGLHTATFTHDGRRPFTVSVMNSDGREFDRIIEASGQFTGTAAITVRGDPFAYLVIDIRVDGNWTMTID